MIVTNRRTFVPVLLWTLGSAGLFLLALVQKRTGLEVLPSLTFSSAFGWIASLLLLYLLLVWPLTLEILVERFARRPLTQGQYAVLALQEPGLLVLYSLPVLVLSASYGFKSVWTVLQTLVIFLMVGLVIWAHFRLGFYFHGNMAKPFYFLAGLLCVFIPGLNVSLEAFFEKGAGWLNNLNPFFALFHVSSPAQAPSGVFLVFCLIFGGLAVVLAVLPFLLALPPRAFEDIVAGG